MELGGLGVVLGSLDVELGCPGVELGSPCVELGGPDVELGGPVTVKLLKSPGVVIESTGFVARKLSCGTWRFDVVLQGPSRVLGNPGRC